MTLLGVFGMNDILWHVWSVPVYDSRLIDRTGRYRVATTDPETRGIYLAENLDGYFRQTVILHELGHCALYSYHLLDQLHKAVYPEYWVEAEEWVCNFIADYGKVLFAISNQL